MCICYVISHRHINIAKAHIHNACTLAPNQHECCAALRPLYCTNINILHKLGVLYISHSRKQQCMRSLRTLREATGELEELCWVWIVSVERFMCVFVRRGRSPFHTHLNVFLSFRFSTCAFAMLPPPTFARLSRFRVAYTFRPSHKVPGTRETRADASPPTCPRVFAFKAYETTHCQIWLRGICLCTLSLSLNISTLAGFCANVCILFLGGREPQLPLSHHVIPVSSSYNHLRTRLVKPAGEYDAADDDDAMIWPETT